MRIAIHTYTYSCIYIHTYIYIFTYLHRSHIFTCVYTNIQYTYIFRSHTWTQIRILLHMQRNILCQHTPHSWGLVQRTPITLFRSRWLILSETSFRKTWDNMTFFASVVYPQLSHLSTTSVYPVYIDHLRLAIRKASVGLGQNQFKISMSFSMIFMLPLPKPLRQMQQLLMQVPMNGTNGMSMQSMPMPMQGTSGMPMPMNGMTGMSMPMPGAPDVFPWRKLPILTSKLDMFSFLIHFLNLLLPYFKVIPPRWFQHKQETSMNKKHDVQNHPLDDKKNPCWFQDDLGYLPEN